MDYTEASKLIKLDYSKKLQEMIKEGEYDFISWELDGKDFSFAEFGQKEIKIYLFSFTREITTAEAFTQIRDWGFKPVSAVELLAIGSQLPDLQKDWDIVALGSNIFGENIPILLRDFSLADPGDPKRGLALASRRKIWDTRCRFPAVKIETLC